MNKTINQLSDLPNVENDDELVVWDITAGTSKKAKARQFKNIFISATSTTVTGAGLMSGSVVKIMFTSAITGSNTTTGMSISYNGTSYAVKVGKNGSLASFVASDISGTYTYLQAYTTLELAFDGTQFIIIGNPVVISNSDYTIYADGSSKYSKSKCDEQFVQWTIKNSSLATRVTINEDGFFILTVSNAGFNNQRVGCYLIYKSSTQIIFISKIFENYITVTPNYNEVVITDYTGDGVECSVHKIGVYWD